MTIFRPAYESDLKAMYEVFYQNEIRDSPDLRPPRHIPPYMRHVLQTGTLSVAEQDGEIIAFAGAITREKITFLTDLFVLPAHQSKQLGKTLLQSVLPQDHLIHCTIGSPDPRALALYIRTGMRPQWPYIVLVLERPAHKWEALPHIQIVEAAPDDPALVHWDAQISGRKRPTDHSHWVHEQQAVPLWFQQEGQTIGYEYVRLAGTETLWYPEAYALGPIGASTEDIATACVLAATDWALRQTQTVLLGVPGPHPCLTPLLARGFHIIDIETFLSSAQKPFFDPQCYVPSGGDLF